MPLPWGQVEVNQAANALVNQTPEHATWSGDLMIFTATSRDEIAVERLLVGCYYQVTHNGQNLYAVLAEKRQMPALMGDGQFWGFELVGFADEAKAAAYCDQVRQPLHTASFVDLKAPVDFRSDPHSPVWSHALYPSLTFSANSTALETREAFQWVIDAGLDRELLETDLFDHWTDDAKRTVLRGEPPENPAERRMFGLGAFVQFITYSLHTKQLPGSTIEVGGAPPREGVLEMLLFQFKQCGFQKPSHLPPDWSAPKTVALSQD